MQKPQGIALLVISTIVKVLWVAPYAQALVITWCKYLMPIYP